MIQITSVVQPGLDSATAPLTLAGLVFLAFGIVFLCKVWWSLRFNFSSDISVAGYVALVIICFILMWIGMGLIATGLHFVSLACVKYIFTQSCLA